MTTGQKWFVLICLMVGSGLGVLIAQQQMSGGQAVTITSGTVAVTQATAANLKVDLSGTAANATAIKVDPSAVTSPVSLASLPALVAGTAKVGVTYPWTPCGTTSFETGSPVGVAAMPTVSTAIAAATTCALTVIVSNTSAGALTYTISDNAGSPINFLNAVTINAGERDEYTFPNGMKFNAGIKVQASGAGVTYYINGLQ